MLKGMQRDRKFRDEAAKKEIERLQTIFDNIVKTAGAITGSMPTIISLTR